MWLHKYSAPLIKLAKFECQDSCSHGEEQKRQQYITGYHVTVVFYEEHMSPFISSCRIYIATFILQGHLSTSSMCVISTAVAWSWISRHHHALLNNSSLSHLAGTLGKLSDLSNTCNRDAGNCLLREERIGDRERFSLSLVYSQGICRKHCASQIPLAVLTGEMCDQNVCRSEARDVPEWLLPAQIVFEI